MKEYIKAVSDYIRENAPKMLKPTDGVFNHPFLDPGAMYANNLWDWDSYWSAKALLEYCEYYKNLPDFDYDEMRKKIIVHIKGNILNFFDQQLDDGFIPMTVTATGLMSSLLKDEHLAGKKVNQHKPFLCSGTLNACKAVNDFSWFDAMPLKKYLAYYDKYQFDEKSGLYFWRNDVMIGVDNNPTVFGYPEDCCADVYLNCFLYSEFCAMHKILESRGERDLCYLGKAENLKSAIRSELYDARDDLYYSAYLDIKTRKTENFHHGLGVFWKSIPIKIRFWGCFLPIMCGITTAEEGKAILKKHYLDKNVSCRYGVRTLAKDEKMYCLEKSSNPSNWLGAVWIIANYCVWKSLKAANMKKEARDLAKKTVKLLGQDVLEHNNMSESYNPETGKPTMEGSFLNWNVLVIEMMRDLSE